MKAITLWQPWASLIALGIKTIETRSWETSYRGPLAIHAAKRRAKGEDMKALVADRPEAWYAWYQGGLVSPDGDTDHMPYGAIVAVCRLTDCASIGGPTSFSTGLVEGGPPDFPGRHVLVEEPSYLTPGPMTHLATLTLDAPGGHVTDLSGQLPYGDYSHGRWGWLLEDIERLAEPIPARGRQGLWDWN